MKRLIWLSILSLIYTPLVSLADPLPVEANTILNRATEIRLYEIDPAGKGRAENALRGHGILSEKSFSDTSAVKTVAGKLQPLFDNKNLEVDLCFDANRGISFTDGKRSFDLLISTRCMHARLFERDDARIHVDGRDVSPNDRDDIDYATLAIADSMDWIDGMLKSR